MVVAEVEEEGEAAVEVEMAISKAGLVMLMEVKARMAKKLNGKYIYRRSGQPMKNFSLALLHLV